MNCRRAAHCVLAAALSFATGAAWAQIYRWTDEKGRVHITDTPPPAGAKDVQKKASSPPATGTAYEPYALQLARKNAPVTLYSTPRCDACNRARALLNARGVPFAEVSVVSQKEVDELTAAVGNNAVPSIVVGPTAQQGFEEALYQRILDEAGYPPPGIAPVRAQQEPKPAAVKVDAPAQTAPQAAPGPAPGPYAPGASRQPQSK